VIDLTGRTVLVTGGGRGVGQAISWVLAEQGADVAVADINLAHAQEVAGDVTAMGRRSMALDLDVSSRESVFTAVDQIVSEWGQIDILVNNAGITEAPNNPTRDIEVTWDKVLKVNLMGVINCTDAVMRHMASRRYGKVVNIASTAGRPGDPLRSNNGPAPEGAPPPQGGSAYSASKAAVIRTTQNVAAAAARFNINVNCVCPSRMITPMGLNIAGRGKDGISEGEAHEARRMAVLEVNRFGRELEPVDVAKAVAFLVSEDARNITGHSLHVDGGFKMN
jgi:NAD(P)-dependent dehydrogenase (short-subunit alcohol dehydrogenase family)